MNKGELVRSIAKKANISLSQAEKILNITIDDITQALKKGERILLVGFGTFGTKKRSARKGRNPQTGKEMKIPAKRVAYFKAGTKLKKAVNR
jgi:DNA-binding protein HU-beta